VSRTATFQRSFSTQKEIERLQTEGEELRREPEAAAFAKQREEENSGNVLLLSWEIRTGGRGSGMGHTKQAQRVQLQFSKFPY
jgi:hypothetical protein